MGGYSTRPPMKTVDLDTARKAFGAKGSRVEAFGAMDVSPSPFQPLTDALPKSLNRQDRPLEKRSGSVSKKRRDSRENVNPRQALKPTTCVTKDMPLSVVASAVAPTGAPADAVAPTGVRADAVAPTGAPADAVAPAVADAGLKRWFEDRAARCKDNCSMDPRVTFLSTGHCEPWDTANHLQKVDAVLSLKQADAHKTKCRPISMMASNISMTLASDTQAQLAVSGSCEDIVKRLLDLDERHNKHVPQYVYQRAIFPNTHERADSGVEKAYRKKERTLLCMIARHVSEEMQHQQYQAYVPSDFIEAAIEIWGDSEDFYRDLSRLGFLLYICINHSEMNMESCLAIREIHPPVFLFDELQKFMQKVHPLEDVLALSRTAGQQHKQDETVSVVSAERTNTVDHMLTDHTLTVVSTWFQVLLSRMKPSRFGLADNDSMADRAAYAVERFQRGSSASPYIVLAERSDIDPPKEMVRRALKLCGV